MPPDLISEVRELERIYLAICGARQATGATPGQALDALERELAALGRLSGTVEIVSAISSR